MGLNPIGYKPWAGRRTEHNRRFLVIADSIVRHKLKSKGFLAMLILGTILVHVLPLMLYSLMPHEVLEADLMRDYMGDGLFFIFSVILVSLVCSDLLSDDLRSNSIILYLSRALRVEGYLLGKWTGAMICVGLFTLLPPLVVGVAITATQSGGDYLASLAVIGRTFVAGLWSAVLLVPLGMMISSITSRRTFAGVGTFMAFFTLMIISGIFTEFSRDWTMLSPDALLRYSQTVIFGLRLPSHADPVLMGAAILALTVPPLLLVYHRLRMKGAGR